VHPESTGTGRAAGFEVLVRRDRGWLTGWVAYTLSKAERDLYGRTVPFDFDRRHALAAALQLRLSENLRASVTTQFATGFPMTPVRREVEFFQYRNRDGTLDPIYRPQGFANRTFDTSPVGYPFRLSLQNSERLQPYARTDVRVTYALGDHWELYGEVINLFDRTNFVRNDPAVGYYELYDSYPILPTYGVRVKF
jgi:outer membrane receptor protein involved in Fe transport